MTAAPGDAPPPGATRIDTHSAEAVQAWASRFGVTADEVLEAVRTVGDVARDVEAFLRGGGERVP